MSSEFPPQQPALMPQQEALAQPEPVPVEYPEIRAAYRALQNGTATREELIALGDKLEPNTIYEPDENGAQQLVGFRGKIPKAATNVVYEAAKAARESDDPKAWKAAAKLDDIHALSFSQAKALVRSLNQGESFTSAVAAATEAPKHEVVVAEEAESAVEASDSEDGATAEKKETTSAAVDTALKQLKEAGGAKKVAETLNALDDTQREAVAAKLVTKLTSELSERFKDARPGTTAEGLDDYLAGSTTPENVRALQRKAVANLLDDLADRNPLLFDAIVSASTNSFIRENYAVVEELIETGETPREHVAPQAGGIAVKSQLGEASADELVGANR